MINHTGIKDVATAQGLLTQLDSIHAQYPENNEITVLLANGLGSLLYLYTEKLSRENISLYFEKIISLVDGHLDKVEILTITVIVIEKIVNQEGQIQLLPKYLLPIISNHFQNQKWQEGFEYFVKLRSLYSENIENEALAGLTFVACQLTFVASLQLNNQEEAKSIFENMQFIANKFDKNEEIQGAWQEFLASLKVDE